MQKYALRVIFPQETDLGKDLPTENCNPKWGITEGTEHRFIHQTFAEYFASKYLIDNVEDETVIRVLMKTALIESRYRVIRYFVNGFIDKMDHSTLDRILKKYTTKQSA